jgi:hypothetical protein
MSLYRVNTRFLPNFPPTGEKPNGFSRHRSLKRRLGITAGPSAAPVPGVSGSTTREPVGQEPIGQVWLTGDWSACASIPTTVEKWLRMAVITMPNAHAFGNAVQAGKMAGTIPTIPATIPIQSWQNQLGIRLSNNTIIQIPNRKFEKLPRPWRKT